MKDILKNIADLIKVKTIITLIVVIVWAILAMRTGSLAEVKDIVLMVIAFYFGTVYEKSGTKK